MLNNYSLNWQFLTDNWQELLITRSTIHPFIFQSEGRSFILQSFNEWLQEAVQGKRAALFIITLSIVPILFLSAFIIFCRTLYA